jgi:hypothetical protein
MADRSSIAMPGFNQPPLGCDTPYVPTDIYCAGGDVRITVDEDPSQVAEAFNSADGHSLRLTSGGDEVYFNPRLVAFWSTAEVGSEAESPPESEKSSIRRQAVTDLWGNPIRSKPRG